MGRILLGFLFFMVSFSLVAQQSKRDAASGARCTQSLSQAEDRYKAGILQGIPQLLAPCLRSGNFSKEETIRAHKLLTLVHIFNDNDALADESMVNLLKADPEHKYNQVIDPAEFIFLYNKFRTQPIFRAGIRGGVNISSANIISSYSSNSYGDVTKTYASQTGIGLDLSLEKEFFKYFEGVGSVGYHGKSFTYAQADYFNIEGASAGSRGPDPVVENQSWLDANVGIRFIYKLDKFVPFAYVGGAVNYLLSTDESATRGAVSTSGTDLVKTENREQLNFSMVGGVGVKLKMKVDFLSFEARYVNGLTNLVNVRNRYPRPDTFGTGSSTENDIKRQDRMFSTGVVDDNFSLNSIMLSVQYTKSFYNPKKLR